MHSGTELNADLKALKRRWEQITDIPESPRSLLDVIEYTLGSQKKAEVYVNRLLTYFLDPEQPHGMDAEFLTAFLEGLPDDCDFQEDVHDLSTVEVDEQVRVNQVEDDESVSTGIVDLVIEVPNEWFLLIELKFSAKDTQTEFYYRDATHVGGRAKTDYESGQYYLYLHQHDRPDATEPEFANWTWKAFSNDVLEDFLIENAVRYPQRTVAQLREFNDDIQDLVGMTDQQENDHEKIALYLEHYDAITDVAETFDTHWETFSGEWGRRLGAALEQDDVGLSSEFGDDLIAFDVETDDGNQNRWIFRTGSSDWGMIFKEGWWRHTDDLEGATYAHPDGYDDVRIGFHHRLERNRDLAVGDKTLKLYFRNMGANDQEFIDSFTDHFYENEEDLTRQLPATAEITGNKRNMITASYDIKTAAYDDFFGAYTGALKQAFLDHVVDNEELILDLDEVYCQSVQDVYDVSITPR